MGKVWFGILLLVASVSLAQDTAPDANKAEETSNEIKAAREELAAARKKIISAIDADGNSIAIILANQVMASYEYNSSYCDLRASAMLDEPKLWSYRSILVDYRNLCRKLAKPLAVINAEKEQKAETERQKVQAEYEARQEKQKQEWEAEKRTKLKNELQDLVPKIIAQKKKEAPIIRAALESLRADNTKYIKMAEDRVNNYLNTCKQNKAAPVGLANEKASAADWLKASNQSAILTYRHTLDDRLHQGRYESEVANFQRLNTELVEIKGEKQSLPDLTQYDNEITSLKQEAEDFIKQITDGSTPSKIAVENKKSTTDKLSESESEKTSEKITRLKDVAPGDMLLLNDLKTGDKLIVTLKNQKTLDCEFTNISGEGYLLLLRYQGQNQKCFVKDVTEIRKDERIIFKASPDGKLFTSTPSKTTPSGVAPAKSSAKSLLNMAKQYQNAGNDEKAKQYAKRVKDEYPDSPEAKEADVILTP